MIVFITGTEFPLREDTKMIFNPVSELVVGQHKEVKPPCPVIDIHTHFGPLLLGEDYDHDYDIKQISEKLQKMNIQKAVSLELVWDEAYDRLQEYLEGSDGLIIPFGSVDVSQALKPDFEKLVYRTLHSLKAKGSKGIKLWKDMTLNSEKYFGKMVRLDDERYKPVWQTCAEEHLPVLIHIGDPPSLFKPIDEHNEHFVCLNMHPEWSWLKPGMFTFEEHMQMQENILRDNPETIFVIAHVGSYAENLKQVGEWLDCFPNMFIDVSGRIDQLGRQPFTAKAFFEKYQDRILFGTDYEPNLDVFDFYHTHYRFFQTQDEYFEHPFPDMLGQWRIYGLNLDLPVLEKLYYKNAQAVFVI